jgi:regulatory protein
LPAEYPRNSPRAPKSLKARAVALLARREYSRADLREKLAAGAGRNSDAMSEIDAVLDDLAQLGYLSDTRFAKALVRQKSGAYSKRAIGATLKARGVTGEAAADALAGSEIDDHDAMVALWRRRFGAPPVDQKQKARQVRFLQSRGFPLSAIFKLLRDPPSPDGGES